VVVYEMLTGRRLFQGDSVTEVLAAVVRDTPDLSAVPPALRRLLEKCLEKEPRKRLRDISSVPLLLDEPLPVNRAAQPSRVPRRRLQWLAAAGGVGLLLAVVLLFGPWRQTNAGEAAFEFSIHAPYGTVLVEPYSIAAVSPDGRHLLFATSVTDPTMSAGSTERHRLWLRRTDSSEARPLPGTDGASAATWSPDSQSIAFVANQTLRRIDLAGGQPVKVADSRAPIASMPVPGTATASF
jgi:eukaryotic-like serine/threonine-protein kinase